MDEITGKKFTAAQLEEAERAAFNAAKERQEKMGSWTEFEDRFQTFEDYKKQSSELKFVDKATKPKDREKPFEG